MDSKKYLNDLPPEVLMEIFEFVPNKDPLKHTCPDFCKIISKIETKQFRLVIKDVRH